MTAKQLTDSILQMAIQGKLVPQDPNDEPASALLERIREEKRRLVKEGKLKKKDLEETAISEDEVPFKIPDGWICASLSTLSLDSADGPFGSNLKKEHYTDNKEVRIIQLSNIGEEGWRNTNVKYTTFEHLECIKRSEAFAGDIIIAKMMPAGRSIICPIGNEKYVLSSDAVRFNFPPVLNKEYLYYAINSNIFRRQVYGDVQGITRVRTSLTKLRNYYLPIPPHREQMRIVGRIKEFLSLIKEYGEAYEEASKMDAELPDKLKKSILQDAIMGKLGTQDPNDEPASVLLEQIREEKKKLVKEGKLKKKDLEETPINEDEVPFKIPESWEWYRLSGISQIYTGNSISESEKAAKYTDVDGINYIGTKDINFDHSIKYNNGIRIPNQYLGAFKIASVGSILMCIEGGSAGRKIGILSEEVCFGNKLCCFSPICVFNRYLYYYLQSPILKDLFKSNITGIIGGVSISKLAPIIIPLPPLAEQHRIVEKIEALFAEIDNMTINDITTNEEETKETETE